VDVDQDVGEEGNCDTNCLDSVPVFVIVPLRPLVLPGVIEVEEDRDQEKSQHNAAHHEVEDDRHIDILVGRTKPDVEDASQKGYNDDESCQPKINARKARLPYLEVRQHHCYPVHVEMLLEVNEVVETEPLEDLDADRQVLDDRLRSQDELRPCLIKPALKR
jgi:hypothetical protein